MRKLAPATRTRSRQHRLPSVSELDTVYLPWHIRCCALHSESLGTLLIKLNYSQRFSVLEGRNCLMTLKTITPADPYPSLIKKLIPCILVIYASQQRPLRFLFFVKMMFIIKETSIIDLTLMMDKIS